ncbi:hypothetical protein [Patulibacter sp.]|uniref:hypothetical protein n=1 Tax=Patulibacter sp. TaxID=1912859 RepID=UPI002728D98E|nr:hypothetical protein [Patulibacter sp.]MDO9409414.1 hypothetical protein [Patulibacter sp.]
MSDRESPSAVRAAASVRPSRWRRRPRRFVRYDALWADGRVELDVGLSDAMYRGHPADFEPVRRAVHAACPEVGTGRWVDDRGAVIDGPGAPASTAPGADGGRPRAYRPPQDRRWASPRTWRLAGGSAAVAVGVPLVTGVLGDGVAGPVGVVLCLSGVAALAGLRPGRD